MKLRAFIERAQALEREFGDITVVTRNSIGGCDEITAMFVRPKVYLATDDVYLDPPQSATTAVYTLELYTD